MSFVILINGKEYKYSPTTTATSGDCISYIMLFKKNYSIYFNENKVLKDHTNIAIKNVLTGEIIQIEN